MLWMCAGDCAVNQVTVRSTYPVPDIAEEFDWSSKAAFLERLEGKSGCGQVRIAEGDKVMRAWVMCSGLDRAIGGVQEGHPIVVESQKLMETEVWYLNHEELTDKRSYTGSVQRCGEPLEVIKWMGRVAYRFKLQGRMKFHPTFHVSFLKPYLKKADRGRQQVRQAQSSERERFENQVDHRTKRASRTSRRSDYLMRWEGSSEAHATWGRNVVLWQLEMRINEHVETLPTRTSVSSGGGGFVTPL